MVTIVVTAEQALRLEDCVELALNQFEADDELEKLKNIIKESLA